MLAIWFVIVVSATLGILVLAWLSSLIHDLRRLRRTGRALEIVTKRMRSQFGLGLRRHSDETTSLDRLAGRRVWLTWSFRWGPCGEGFAEIISVAADSSIRITMVEPIKLWSDSAVREYAGIEFRTEAPSSLSHYDLRAIDGFLSLDHTQYIANCQLVVLETEPEPLEVKS